MGECVGPCRWDSSRSRFVKSSVFRLGIFLVAPPPPPLPSTKHLKHSTVTLNHSRRIKLSDSSLVHTRYELGHMFSVVQCTMVHCVVVACSPSCSCSMVHAHRILFPVGVHCELRTAGMGCSTNLDVNLERA